MESHHQITKVDEPVISKHSKMSTQMLTCIQASISDDCAVKVVTRGDTYEVEVKNRDQRETVQDLPLYLRILISRVRLSLIFEGLCLS